MGKQNFENYSFNWCNQLNMREGNQKSIFSASAGTGRTDRVTIIEFTVAL
jgi:hypothetical protein